MRESRPSYCAAAASLSLVASSTATACCARRQSKLLPVTGSLRRRSLKVAAETSRNDLRVRVCVCVRACVRVCVRVYKSICVGGRS